MNVRNHLIFGVHITERIRHVPTVQQLLSEYGCYIKTRLGLHEVDQNSCSPNGLLVLEMFGDEAKCQELFEKLNAVEGVEVKKIVFGHP
ncbi:MAG: hypothetical protein GXY33_12495 [Phycisphaerae bacterium]|nr:hypothetical protein [Phycisphaerae bacterium]